MVVSTELGSAKSGLVSDIPGYIPIPASLVQVWGSCRFNLFQVVSWSRKPQLFCAADYPFSTSLLEMIKNKEPLVLYVHHSDYPDLQAELFSSLEDVVRRNDIALEDRYFVVQCMVATEIKRHYHLINLNHAIDHFHNLGLKISQLVYSTAVIPAELLAIAKHNTDTFKHMINVSTYAVLLAKHLGISEEKTLNQIATGGLLHDIGKRFMPKRLLNKITAFDDKERQLIYQHPRKSYEELHQYESLGKSHMLMVYQHHERMDGQGYPVGITGEEIHLWARICAVVDVFEALTGERHYRKPEPIPQALDYLSKNAGSHFDKEIVQCWQKIVR
jgi:HD-GYP domain-containing protein (c-di-GMP phosphodiesterase class II)